MNALLESLHRGLGTEMPADLPRLDSFDWRAAGIETRYMVCITPRSGSTWLEKLLASTRLCGSPGEFFNEKNISVRSRNLGASGFQEYFERIVRKSQSDSTFGFEINYGRLQNFAELVDIESVFLRPGTRFVAMFRRDLLAQAISTLTAIKSGVWHRKQDGAPLGLEDAAGKKSAPVAADLDDESLWWWILRLHVEERGWQTFFDDHGITPFRIFYEDLCTASHYQVLRILRFVKEGRIELDGALLDTVAGLKNDTQRLADEFTWQVWSRFTFEYFDELEALYRERSSLDPKNFRKMLADKHGLRIARVRSS